jgi:predicted nucleic acid-binding protein
MPGSQVKGLSCILDTDIVIDFLRRHEYARNLLEHWADGGLLAVSSLTHLELYQGMKPGEEKATNSLLDGLITIDVDMSIARQAGTLLRNLRLKGITIGMADAIIGVTALQSGVPLITNNVEHYPFPGLRVIRGAGIKHT